MQTVKRAKELYRKGLYKDAFQELLKSKGESEDPAERTYLLGLCAIRLEEYLLGIEYFRDIVSDETDKSKRVNHSRTLIGYAMVMANNYSGAIEYLEGLISNGFSEEMVFTSLAYAYFGIEEYEKGIEALEKVLDKSPMNSTALNSLGFILADTGKDLSNAVKYCEAAVSLKPDYAPYLDSLGWAWHKRGEDSKALLYLRKAVKLEPENNEIRKHLERIVGKR